MHNQDLKYWIALSKCDFDSIYTVEAYRHFGSIQEVWHASTSDVAQIETIGLQKASNMAERKKTVNPDEAFDEIMSRNIQVLTYEDTDYPDRLRQIHNPPASLFIKGDLSDCNLDKVLAVVGSRKASHSILEILGKIIRTLPSPDITVISGMALGIDTCAHQAALDANLKTIAVLGGGFDFVYPTQNKNLFAKIIDGNGAVLSEYYPTIEPIAWQFPHRNRIVSGMSKGVLVAEAAEKSGALITAHLALEQNKELMCIPGLITNPNAKGTNNLIKSGAALITEAQDIMDALNWQNEAVSPHQKEKIENKLLDNEQKVYKTLTLEAKSIDEILKETALSTAELMVILTSLELQGIIKQIPQEKFIRIL
jgi:DNA processing protein